LSIGEASLNVRSWVEKRIAAIGWILPIAGLDVQLPLCNQLPTENCHHRRRAALTLVSRAPGQQASALAGIVRRNQPESLAA